MAIFALFIRKGEVRKEKGEKKARYLILLFPLFFLVLIYRQLDIPFLNEDAAFYYSLGGAVAFLWERRQCGVPTLPLFALSLFFFIQTLLPHAIGILLITTVLYRISMALFILFLFLFLFRKMDCKRAEVRFNARREGVQIEKVRNEGVQKEKVRKEEARKIGRAHGILSVLEGLSKMNFYIYAVHYLFLRLWFFLQNVMYASMEKNPTGFSGSGKEEAVKLLFYLLSPAYCLFLAYLTGKGLKKLSPRLWKALNGGRG